MWWRRSRKSQDDPVEEGPFAQKGFIASAVVVGFVVLAAVFGLAVDPLPPSSVSSGRAPTGAGSGAGTPGATQAGVASDSSSAPAGSCAPPAARGTELPESQPADTRWRSLDGILLPTSATIGPAIVAGGIARCYAHTPVGAVFAAMNGSWRYRHTSDWGAAVQYLLAPGPGRDAYIRQRTSTANGDTRSPTAPTEEETARPRGFRVLEHSLERARIGIVTEELEGGPVMQAIWTVVWVDGDWRIELPADGQPPPRAQTNLEDGFVPWDSASMDDITNESTG